MTKLLRKILTVIDLALAWALFALSHAVPRGGRVWVFIGWHRLGNKEFFADNAKYLFLFASAQAKESGITPIWLSPDAALVLELRARGYRAYRETSVHGMYFALRAGYTCIDSHLSLRNWRFTGGSRIIQLWHGVPTKLIGYQSPKHVPPTRFLSPGWHVRPHLTISTSEAYSSIMREAFRLDPKSLPITGYPRNDVLLGEIAGSDIGTVPLPPALPASRRILYAPTFRPDGSNPLDHLDLSRMYDFLCTHDASLYLSLHPKLAAFRPRWEARFGGRIHFIDGGHDIYPHLRSFDVCITDYSSTATDYLLLDRPVIYYQYDRSEYESGSGLQKYEAVLAPGPHCNTFDDLASVLSDILGGTDAFAPARAIARACAFAHADSGSAARVFETILRNARLTDSQPL